MRTIYKSTAGKKKIIDEDNIIYMPTTYQDVIDNINNLSQTYPDTVLDYFINQDIANYESFRD